MSISTIAERLGFNNRLFDTILTLLNMSRVPQKKPAEMKRFLFLQYDTNALGAAITATPLYEALRRAIPDAYIAVATGGFSYQALKCNPYIDKVYETPHPHTHFLKSAAYFLGHMRQWRKNFDCVITDTFNAHSKATALQIFSGIPVRAGYSNRSAWVHYPITLPKEYHILIQTSVITNNLRILDMLGQSYQATEPSMFFKEDELHSLENLLKAEDVPEEGPLVVVVAQGSGRQPHIWYEDRFAEVGNRLHDLFGARLVFSGTSHDSAGIERIRHQMRVPSFSLAGKTNIPQVAALLCSADLMLTMDTGVMHVGRAVGVPMVILTSASQTPKEWLPLGMEKYLILRRDHVPCALCWKTECATRECMDEISIDDVVNAVQTQLRRFPPSSEQRHERLSRALTKRRVPAANSLSAAALEA